jgi:hypothetical protein
MNRLLLRAVLGSAVVLGGSLAWAVTPGEATQLLVTGYDGGTGNLAITYDPACSSSDHNIEFGPLQNVDTLGYSGQDCGIGTSGSYSSFNPGSGSFFFLVVGNDGAGTEGSYGTNLIGGAPGERSEDLTDPQCSFVQDLSQRCDGPFSPELDLTAYRPASEAYGAPLQRAAVPDLDEESPGTGIRINGDDDNGNAQPDRDDTGVAGENDLIEITLTLDPPTPASGFEYVLERSSSNLRVWNEATKATEVITSGDTAVLNPPGVTSTLWVENPSGGSADLWLSARPTGGGPDVATDRVHFYPCHGIIIALGGEGQVPEDPPNDPGNQGTFDLAITLYQMGYDVHMYDEDVVPANGAGAAFNEVVSAVQDRGVTGVTIFGYSHGGGSTNDLAIRLDDNRAGIGTFSIEYTAYMDGIDNDSDFDTGAETQIPASTQCHDNYYERVCPIVVIFPLCGNSIPGSDLDLNVNTTPWGVSLGHFEIDDAPEVLDGIRDRIVNLPVTR